MISCQLAVQTFYSSKRCTNEGSNHIGSDRRRTYKQNYGNPKGNPAFEWRDEEIYMENRLKGCKILGAKNEHVVLPL